MVGRARSSTRPYTAFASPAATRSYAGESREWGRSVGSTRSAHTQTHWALHLVCCEAPARRVWRCQGAGPCPTTSCVWTSETYLPTVGRRSMPGSSSGSSSSSSSRRAARQSTRAPAPSRPLGGAGRRRHRPSLVRRCESSFMILIGGCCRLGDVSLVRRGAHDARCWRVRPRLLRADTEDAGCRHSYSESEETHSALVIDSAVL